MITEILLTLSLVSGMPAVGTYEMNTTANFEYFTCQTENETTMFYISNNNQYAYRNVDTNQQYNCTDIIKDKYIIKNSDVYFDNDLIKVGKNPLQNITPSGTLYNEEYLGIIEISFPNFNPEAIVSVSLAYKIESQTPLNYSTSSFSLSKINNESYDNIDGYTNLSTSNSISCSYENGFMLFNITSHINNSLITNNTLLYLLKNNDILNNGYYSFYSSSSNFKPYLIIETNPNIIGSTLYGNAPEYEEITNNTTGISRFNCFAYALEKNDKKYCICGNTHVVDPKPDWPIIKALPTSNVSFETIYNNIVHLGSINNYEIEMIDSYDSYIYPNERRIAFAYQTNGTDLCPGTQFHFIRENNDGSWSGKIGEEHTTCSPYFSETDLRILPNINSPVYFFKVRKITQN